MMDENKIDMHSEIPGFMLPKKLAGTAEGEKVAGILQSNLKPVKPGSGYYLPLFQFTLHIKEALNSARRRGSLIRGMEDAEKMLDAERAGILSVDMKTGHERVERISRLIVAANDGSDRFYRLIKRVAGRNRPRVMAIELDMTSYELGEAIFGPGKRALFLLVNHKDAVINLLKSLII
jgi:hypothetical protein